jgi:Fe/S biogenesis protein NfuA
LSKELKIKGLTMIEITPVAQAHFKKLLEPQKEGTGIRVFVVNPGTPRAECGVSYCPPEAVEDSDTRFNYDGFDAFIDDVSLPFLEEAFIDLVEEETGTQLTLKAPNAKMRKVKDDAPLLERVEYVIQTQINPQLASHGGFIKLIEITEDNTAIIEFGGGCNGCAQVDLTLSDGIEKELLEAFPAELNAVQDLTKHQTGEHSFYK